MSTEIVGIVFSKDRAMQLDATLKSFYLNCLDPNLIQLKVIHVSSSKLFANQYSQLKKEYPQVKFVNQGNFKQDVFWLLGMPGTTWGRLLLRLRFSRLDLQEKYVLFLVDDNIFIRNFHLSDALAALESEKDALCFSLQLGTNLTYCYPLDIPLRFPAYLAVAGQVIKYRWTEAGGGLNYPLEVSSSLYRLSDIAKLLMSLNFSNPNILEGQMAARASDYRSLNPYLLCFKQSVTFCNPLNKVQSVYDNKAGDQPENSTDALARRFDEGYRIDVDAYRGLVPTACHQEVEFSFSSEA